MTKTAEKPYPLGPAHTYIAHIREYPRGVGQLCRLDRWSKICLDHGTSKEPVNPWPERIHCFFWCTMIQTDLGSPIPIRPHSKGTQPIVYSSGEDRLRTWRFTMFTLDEILDFVVKDAWIFQIFASHDFKIAAREGSLAGQKFLLTEQFLQWKNNYLSMFWNFREIMNLPVSIVNLSDRCFCYSTVAMLVPFGKAPTWRLHTSSVNLSETHFPITHEWKPAQT